MRRYEATDCFFETCMGGIPGVSDIADLAIGYGCGKIVVEHHFAEISD